MGAVKITTKRSDQNQVAVVLALAFIFWPWALGVLDCGWWAITGATLSGIPWLGDAGRGWLLMLWPIVGVVLGFVGLLLITL